MGLTTHQFKILVISATVAEFLFCYVIDYISLLQTTYNLSAPLLCAHLLLGAGQTSSQEKFQTAFKFFHF
jgi:hypothetical protein